MSLEEHVSGKSILWCTLKAKIRERRKWIPDCPFKTHTDMLNESKPHWLNWQCYLCEVILFQLCLYLKRRQKLFFQQQILQLAYQIAVNTVFGVFYIPLIQYWWLCREGRGGYMGDKKGQSCCNMCSSFCFVSLGVISSLQCRPPLPIKESYSLYGIWLCWHR